MKKAINLELSVQSSMLCCQFFFLIILAADQSPERARELKRLVHALPEAHYETLKYLIQHLRRVVAHSSFNKMEARNLAIVFGPTLVRAASDDMLAMVNDMSSQCRIIESFLTHVSIHIWYITAKVYVSFNKHNETYKFTGRVSHCKLQLITLRPISHISYSRKIC